MHRRTGLLIERDTARGMVLERAPASVERQVGPHERAVDGLAQQVEPQSAAAPRPRPRARRPRRAAPPAARRPPRSRPHASGDAPPRPRRPRRARARGAPRGAPRPVHAQRRLAALGHRRRVDRPGLGAERPRVAVHAERVGRASDHPEAQPGAPAPRGGRAGGRQRARRGLCGARVRRRAARAAPRLAGGRRQDAAVHARRERAQQGQGDGFLGRHDPPSPIARVCPPPRHGRASTSRR